MKLRIGVLALQGAFSKHVQVLRELGVDPLLVRKPADLNEADGLIIPGGESTTILRQIHFIQMKPALEAFARNKPIFGTCAGLILMSREILGDGSIGSLDFLDIAVRRNGFGRQSESFSLDLEINLPKIPSFTARSVFIRAPRIEAIGKEVSVLASYGDEPVFVKQGCLLASTFHPELTKDRRIHKYFLGLVRECRRKVEMSYFSKVEMSY